MNKLFMDIRKTIKEVKPVVDKRMRYFSRKKNKEDIFIELSFCILTANFSAERGWKIEKEIGNGFINLSKANLEKELRRLGHRFPRMRAEYIVMARRHIDEIYKKVVNAKDKKRRQELREWLVRNIKGIGWKEASHFLRNIGFKDYAIIDSHILDLLEKNKLIIRPKTLTKRRYLNIENILEKICNSLKISQAELDLYLWYMETGKIMK